MTHRLIMNSPFWRVLIHVKHGLITPKCSFSDGHPVWSSPSHMLVPIPSGELMAVGPAYTSTSQKRWRDRDVIPGRGEGLRDYAIEHLRPTERSRSPPQRFLHSDHAALRLCPNTQRPQRISSKHLGGCTSLRAQGPDPRHRAQLI